MVFLPKKVLQKIVIFQNMDTIRQLTSVNIVVSGEEGKRNKINENPNPPIYRRIL